MRHPERVNTQVTRAGSRFTPAGWLTIYTLAALMTGVLIYVGAR